MRYGPPNTQHDAITKVNHIKGEAPEAQAQERRQMGESEMMTAQEVAEYYRCTPRKIYTLLNNGKLRGVKIGGRWLFPREYIHGKSHDLRTAKRGA